MKAACAETLLLLYHQDLTSLSSDFSSDVYLKVCVDNLPTDIESDVSLVDMLTIGIPV